MNFLPEFDFGPSEVCATDEIATLPRCVRIAVLTSQTCGEPCWHAREEICRCSCGGRNHGCLLVPGGEAPERTAKIDGDRYTLIAVGLWKDLIAEAKAINGRQWKSLERPEIVVGSSAADPDGKPWTKERAMAARAAGADVSFSQYYYSWRETDAGAPARLKTATTDQLSRWIELRGWQDRAREGVYILWGIVEMPDAPSTKRVNRFTGEPLSNQSPIGDQV